MLAQNCVAGAVSPVFPPAHQSFQPVLCKWVLVHPGGTSNSH